METLKIILISVVQGLTELLPVSSSGHILLLSKILTVSQSSSFLVFFHLGTTLSILLFFGKRLFSKLFSKERLLFLFKIFVSAIPAGIVGILFDDIISEKLRDEWIIAVSLIVWGVVMIVIDIFTLSKKRLFVGDNVEKVTWKQSLFMGVAQCLALIPGTSRSGITTIAGIVSGLDRYVALEYSFLLGLPVLLGSFVWDVFKSAVKKRAFFSETSLFNYLVIVVITFVIGLMALMVLRNFKKSRWLLIFGIYRVIVGFSILLVCFCVN